MRVSVFSLVLLMSVIAGCSNPWNPYPYINPTVTDTARRGEPKKQATRQEEPAGVQEAPVSATESDASMPMLDEPNFPDDPDGMRGQIPVPVNK